MFIDVEKKKKNTGKVVKICTRFSIRGILRNQPIVLHIVSYSESIINN